jgi:hypothetical protein
LGVVLQMDEAELDRLIRNLEVLLRAGEGAVDEQDDELKRVEDEQQDGE